MRIGFLHSEETKKKMRETALRIGTKPVYRKGFHISEEQKSFLSQINKGRKVSVEVRRKISEHSPKIWLGKKLSEEHKAKMRKPHRILHPFIGLRKPISKETREKMSKARKGISMGVSPQKGKTYQEIYGEKATEQKIKRGKSISLAWDKKGRNPLNRDKHMGFPYVKWRTSVYARDNWTCQTCSIRGGTLEAHHIKSWRNFPLLRLETPNGITLCQACHLLANKEQRKNENRKISM